MQDLMKAEIAKLKKKHSDKEAKFKSMIESLD